MHPQPRPLSAPYIPMTKLLHSIRRRHVTTLAFTLLATWATGGLVACSDAPTSVLSAPPAPVAAPSVATRPAPASYFGMGNTTLVSRQTIGDTTVTQFVVSPWAPLALYDIGNQSKILFPLGATSICDPTSSGYGIGLWDSPCSPLTRSVTITARSWINSTTGSVNTDFSPELRFVPGQPIGVTLFLHDDTPSNTDRIDYCSNGSCVNDSKVDGSVITSRDGSGFDFRVIKHFSGYNVVVD